MRRRVPMPDDPGSAVTEFYLGLTYKDLLRIGIPAVLGFLFGHVVGLALGAGIGLVVAKAEIRGETVDVHALHAAQYVAGTRLSSWYDHVDETGVAALLDDGTVYSVVAVESVDIEYLSDVETAANMATVTAFLKTVDYPSALISGQTQVDLPGGSESVRSADHYVVVPARPSSAETVEERQAVVDRRVDDVVEELNGADMHAERADLTERHEVVDRLLAEPTDIGIRGYETDELCRRVLRVTGFPGEVGSAWLADVLDLDITGTVDVVQRVEGVDDEGVSWLERKWDVARAEELVAGRSSRAEAMNDVADDIQQLLRAQTSGEPLLDYTVYIAVSGEAWDVVDATVEQVEGCLQQRHRIDTRVPWFRTNHAAKVVTGLAPDTLSTGHIVSGQGVAAAFPWAATDTVEEDGVVFGRDRDSGRPVVLDRFSWAAPHVAVMGKTGSGKTFFTKLQLLRCSRVYDDLQVLILDLKPGLEYGDIEAALDCRVERWRIGDRTADDPDILERSLREAYDAARSHEGRSIVVVDEAHRVLDDEAARLVLDKLVREGRSHGLSVMPVTQNTADFTRLDQRGKSMLRQVGCTVFFRHDDVKSQVEEFFRLSGEESAKLHKLLEGSEAGMSEALVRGPLHSTVTIKPGEEEARAVGEPAAAETDGPDSDTLSMPDAGDDTERRWSLPTSLFPDNTDDEPVAAGGRPVMPVMAFTALTTGLWGATALSASGVIAPGYGLVTGVLGFASLVFLGMTLEVNRPPGGVGGEQA